jgi:hypothetical protein
VESVHCLFQLVEEYIKVGGYSYFKGNGT